jgi:hypothetical protein
MIDNYIILLYAWMINNDIFIYDIYWIEYLCDLFIIIYYIINNTFIVDIAVIDSIVPHTPIILDGIHRNIAYNIK